LPHLSQTFAMVLSDSFRSYYLLLLNQYREILSATQQIFRVQLTLTPVELGRDHPCSGFLNSARLI
jgi:hypothetical protein